MSKYTSELTSILQATVCRRCRNCVKWRVTELCPVPLNETHGLFELSSAIKCTLYEENNTVKEIQKELTLRRLAV